MPEKQESMTVLMKFMSNPLLRILKNYKIMVLVGFWRARCIPSILRCQTFRNFRNSQEKIKQLIPLTGGASADINRIILANEDELIVRRTLSQEKSVMAIQKS